MKTDAAEILRKHGIQPSAQRVAVAQYVLFTEDHPSADQVLQKVKASFPMISRATVYNTLNLLVRKKVIRELVLAEGKIVFDPKLDAHHHFIDEATGLISDVPWEYQVVMRGRAKGRRS
jgi:Fur family iron response transcriptional regulator